jgi:hypothetical protein
MSDHVVPYSPTTTQFEPFHMLTFLMNPSNHILRCRVMFVFFYVFTELPTLVFFFPFDPIYVVPPFDSCTRDSWPPHDTLPCVIHREAGYQPGRKITCVLSSRTQAASSLSQGWTRSSFCSSAAAQSPFEVWIQWPKRLRPFA